MKPELKTALDKLTVQGWKSAGDKIVKNYIFKSFNDAMAFMARMKPEIDKLDHHPEWTNVYNKITVNLSTHSAMAVTMKDVELAGIMDKIAANFPKG
jgi:4a-hydroxytetrahydrobiopterin dehydratase